TKGTPEPRPTHGASSLPRIKMSSHPEKEEKKKWKDLKTMKKLEQQGSLGPRLTKGTVSCPGWPYTLSVALPGSILDNTQVACAIFCMDEVMIFDEEGQDAKGVQGSGQEGAGCVQLAHILQYLECPQVPAVLPVLWHRLMPAPPPGLLNPLDSPHHMQQDEEAKFCEGIMVDRPARPGHGSFNCSMKEVGEDGNLEPGLLVTLQLSHKQLPECKTYHGKVVSAQDPRTKAGLYWGYTPALPPGAVFAKAPFQDGYDLTIGTSERGSEVASAQLPSFRHALVVFGDLQGLEAAVGADPNLEVADPRVLFDLYVNTCPGQGSRTIRTEVTRTHAASSQTVWRGEGRWRERLQPPAPGCHSPPQACSEPRVGGPGRSCWPALPGGGTSVSCLQPCGLGC
uniref:SPOUT domain containing methyltransferase 1 n=1 Tax=Oryctolagus cuniculus TaxID=9986 RepID=G1TAZ6_RABIT